MFADRNWIDRTELAHRDSVMADNIIKTIESDSLKKSLIIMLSLHQAAVANIYSADSLARWQM